MASKTKIPTRTVASRPATRAATQPTTQRKPTTINGVNGHHNVNGRDLNDQKGAVPLRLQTAEALQTYFSHLNGDHPRHLYEMVLREVEEPLLRCVLEYVDGNQSRAAEVLGLNRGTLRKKLREHGLAQS